MTDGRIPGKWTSDPKFLEMDWATWGVLTRAIAWCNENGTDGLIQTRYLANLSPDGQAVPAAYNDLVKREIWVKAENGYQFNSWTLPSHRGGLGRVC